MGTNGLRTVNGLSNQGFTLVEVMVSTLVLSIAVLTLLQGFELALRQYALARERWKGTVHAWNRVEGIRANSTKQQEVLQILPQARPLYRAVINLPGQEHMKGWEVLHAEK